MRSIPLVNKVWMRYQLQHIHPSQTILLTLPSVLSSSSTSSSTLLLTSSSSSSVTHTVLNSTDAPLTIHAMERGETAKIIHHPSTTSASSVFTRSLHHMDRPMKFIMRKHLHTISLARRILTNIRMRLTWKFVLLALLAFGWIIFYYYIIDAIIHHQYN